MNDVLHDLVERGGGLVTRTAATQVVPPWTLRYACATGQLVRVLPEVFATAHLLSPRVSLPTLSRLHPTLGHSAVCAWADGRAVLSHLSALHVWGLHQQAPGDPLHLSAPLNPTVRTRPGVHVHRRPGFVVGPPLVVQRDGLPVTRLDQAVVDSWPLLSPTQRRAPVIRAVNDRHTTPERLRHTLDSTPRLTDRPALRTLLILLAEGCRSPLEIWGHEHVFTGPEMPPFQRQVRVTVNPGGPLRPPPSRARGRPGAPGNPGYPRQPRNLTSGTPAAPWHEPGAVRVTPLHRVPLARPCCGCPSGAGDPRSGWLPGCSPSRAATDPRW